MCDVYTVSQRAPALARPCSHTVCTTLRFPTLSKQTTAKTQVDTVLYMRSRACGSLARARQDLSILHVHAPAPWRLLEASEPVQVFPHESQHVGKGRRESQKPPAVAAKISPLTNAGFHLSSGRPATGTGLFTRGPARSNRATLDPPSLCK